MDEVHASGQLRESVCLGMPFSAQTVHLSACLMTLCDDVANDRLSIYAEGSGPVAATIHLAGPELPAALPRLTSPLAKRCYRVPPCGST